MVVVVVVVVVVVLVVVDGSGSVTTAAGAQKPKSNVVSLSSCVARFIDVAVDVDESFVASVPIPARVGVYPAGGVTVTTYWPSGRSANTYWPFAFVVVVTTDWPYTFVTADPSVFVIVNTTPGILVSSSSWMPSRFVSSHT